MPHKRAKRSIRLDRQNHQGHDLAPTAADSLLPIVRTQWDGSPLEGGDKPAEPRAGAANKANKRRKKGGAGTGADDMAGASKSAFRVINAVKLREEYHAAKKRKLEDATKGKNPNQQKKPPAAMQPLPYESLGSFNRRVEQEMRGTVRSAIQQAGSTAQKRKDRKGKKKADGEGDDGDDGEGDDEVDEGPVKRGRDGKLLRKAPKATPDEARDPFAKKPRAADPSADDGDDGDGDGDDARRNRTGRTEFETVSQRRRIGDVVQAPPTLADPARRGLMAKVLGPGGAAACGTTSEGPGVVRLKGAGASGKGKGKGVDAPVGSSRLPINPAMKALLDQERERAVRMYRELKEKREQGKGGAP